MPSKQRSGKEQQPSPRRALAKLDAARGLRSKRLAGQPPELPTAGPKRQRETTEVAASGSSGKRGSSNEAEVCFSFSIQQESDPLEGCHE